MPGLEAENVVVASFGHVYIAPEGTALPTDPTAALPTEWVDIGYVSEDGVTFSLSRDTEDIMAWQSSEAVRRLVTAEPKELTLELLEFDPESVVLAFRGGDLAVSGVAPDQIGTYTPPAPGQSSIHAVTVEWVDQGFAWMFAAKRVEVSGDVEFVLTRTDAIRLALTLAVLAADAPAWEIISNAPSWLVAPGPMGSPNETWTVDELRAAAASAGLPTSGTKAELIERLTTTSAAA